MVRAIVSVGLVAFFALIGLSLSRVVPSLADRSLETTVGGALLAVIALSIGHFFRNRISHFESSIPARKLKGLKVGTLGGLIAFSGLLVAIFISYQVGYWIAVLGIVIGFIGMGMHLVAMFSKDREAR